MTGPAPLRVRASEVSPSLSLLPLHALDSRLFTKEWSKVFADALPSESNQERARYTDEIFFATSTSRSVTLPPTS